MTVQVRRGPVNVTKDPGADLDYGFKWHKYLQTAEVVADSSWTITPSGQLASDRDSINSDGDITIIWFQGGVAGANYIATNHITTDLGREDERSMKVHVVDR